jgi:hypothetical protein
VHFSDVRFSPKIRNQIHKTTQKSHGARLYLTFLCLSLHPNKKERKRKTRINHRAAAFHAKSFFHTEARLPFRFCFIQSLKCGTIVLRRSRQRVWQHTVVPRRRVMFVEREGKSSAISAAALCAQVEDTSAAQEEKLHTCTRAEDGMRHKEEKKKRVSSQVFQAVLVISTTIDDEIRAQRREALVFYLITVAATINYDYKRSRARRQRLLATALINGE